MAEILSYSCCLIWRLYMISMVRPYRVPLVNSELNISMTGSRFSLLDCIVVNVFRCIILVFRVHRTMC